ncbi:MAG: response regulator [Rhodomicrobium sp.]
MRFDASPSIALYGGEPAAWCGTERAEKSPHAHPEDRKKARLDGLRILVVEDEFLVALEVESALERLGCSVVGPFAKLAKALDAALKSPLDGAVLDVNLNGEMVYPLAEVLAGKSVPFVFLTGYSAADLPERFRLFPRLAKPLDAQELLNVFLETRCGGH